ncbi:hypothetical protein Dimus_012533 [Dionaea muscipula]
MQRKVNIQKFILNPPFFGGDMYGSLISSWIVVAVSRELEELKLYFNIMNDWAHGCLFISKTLVVFNLWGGGVSLRIPSSVWLPSLKILNLADIPLLDSSSMTKLFNGCPLLQDLSLESCRWVAGQVYIIPAPMLRCLRIETAVDVLYNPTPMPKVEFIVPRLKCFEFYGEVVELYCIKSATALAIANITVCDRIGWNSVLSLIGGLSNATTLKFSNMIHDVVPDYVEDYHFHSLPKLPIFGNLLELKVTLCPRNFYVVLPQILQHLVSKSPNLQTLIFKEGFRYCYENLREFVQSLIHINMLTKPQGNSRARFFRLC